MNARCSGCGCTMLPSPSIVVMSLLAMDHSGVSQAATAWSPMMTLQAPHSLAPQPKCGPVRPICPRKAPSSEESGSASTSVWTPLRRNAMRGIGKAALLWFSLHSRLVRELFDDIGPFHNIAAKIFVELLRRQRHRKPPLFFPESDDIGPSDHVVDGGVQFVDHRPWRSGRRHKSQPDGRLVSGDAG